VANVLSNPADAVNYVQLTVNPRQQMKDIYDSIKDTQPERAQEIIDNFAFDDTGKAMSDNVTNASYIRKIHDANEKRINDIKDYLRKNSYNVNDTNSTMQTGDEILFRVEALENITESGDNDVIGKLSDVSDVLAKDFKDKVLVPLINDPDYKFKEKIKAYASSLKISISSDVTIEDAVKVLKEMWKNEGGGFVFYRDSDLTNVFVKIKDAIIISNGVASTSDIVNEVKTLNNYDTYFKFYEDHGRISKIADDLKSIYNIIKVIPLLNDQEKYDKFSFELELYQLKNIAIELGEVDKHTAFYGADNISVKEMIQNQLGMVIGLFDMSDSASKFNLWPRSPVQVIGRMIFMKALAFVAPNSWIAQGLILNKMTEGCRGNSICLYVQASQAEAPYYMDLNTTNYTVRSWRPVQPWQQWAGWTAALMHVPSNPRFYVVSPCFAVAKVWKTNLDGQPTIFVHPIKVDMKGKNSNYCYADSDLINAYTAIWAAADAAQIAEIVLTWAVSSGTIGMDVVAETTEYAEEGGNIVISTQTTFGEYVDSTIGKWKSFDPVTLFQAIAEGAISWPGPPFKGMNYTDMLSNNENTQAFNELQEDLKSAYG
jgi:hypothetical protein